MIGRVPKNWQGLHPYRYKSNPLERRFAIAYAEHNTVGSANRSALAYLLTEGDQRFPLEPTERDRSIAATVIQWLGSPVGSSFLKNVLRSKEGIGLMTSAVMETAEEMDLDEKDEKTLRRILEAMKSTSNRVK